MSFLSCAFKRGGRSSCVCDFFQVLVFFKAHGHSSPNCLPRLWFCHVVLVIALLVLFFCSYHATCASLFCESLRSSPNASFLCFDAYPLSHSLQPTSVAPLPMKGVYVSPAHSPLVHNCVFNFTQQIHFQWSGPEDHCMDSLYIEKQECQPPKPTWSRLSNAAYFMLAYRALGTAIKRHQKASHPEAQANGACHHLFFRKSMSVWPDAASWSTAVPSIPAPDTSGREKLWVSKEELRKVLSSIYPQPRDNKDSGAENRKRTTEKCHSPGACQREPEQDDKRPHKRVQRKNDWERTSRQLTQYPRTLTSKLEQP